MRHLSPISRRRRFAGAAAVVSLLLVAAGCAESDSGTDSGTTSTSSAADSAIKEAPAGSFDDKPADGSEIKVGIINPEGGPAISQPEGREGAEAAVEYANQHLGGIAGHKIATVICKSKEDPASAADCGQQMVDAGVAAVVVLNTGNGDAMAPPILEAGIPYTGYQGASGVELASPGTYLWSGGVAAVLAAEAKYAAQHGVKSFAMFATDNAAVVGAVTKMGGPAFEAAGIDFKVTPIPLGNPDSTPQVSAALKSKPDAVGVVGDSTMCSSVAKALDTLGNTAPKYLIPFCLEKSSVDNAGVKAFDNSFVFSSTDTAEGKNDQAALYRAVMAKYAPNTDIHSSSKTGYQSMMGFIMAAQGLQGDPTAADVGKALAAAKDVALPLGGGITFTCDGKAMPGMPGPCSTQVLAGTVENAKVASTEVIK